MTAAERILAATWLHDYLTTDPPEVPPLEEIAEETGDREILTDPEAAAERDLAASAVRDAELEGENWDDREVVGALRWPDGSRLLIELWGDATDPILSLP